MYKLFNFYVKNPHLTPCSLFQVPFEKLLISTDKCFINCSLKNKVAFDLQADIAYPCHLFFESVCGPQKSKQMCQLIRFKKRSSWVSDTCKNCSILPICHTCYGANFITRNNFSYRDMNLCSLQKIRFKWAAFLLFIKTITQFKYLSTIQRNYCYTKIKSINQIWEKLEDV